MKTHGSSVPNHNFREVLSDGGCCRRRKFYIENSKTSFVLKGLYQEKKTKKSFSSSLFAVFRASIVRKNFLKFSLFQGVYSEGGIFKESKKSKLGKKIEENKEEYVLEEKKRILDDNENAYTVLAMLFETVISEEFWIMKEEEKKVSVIPGFVTENKGDYRPRI